jgi:hypothetical protein
VLPRSRCPLIAIPRTTAVDGSTRRDSVCSG